MSQESHRTSVFTFQSSVHSSHVLRCLDEQRQKDLLCDLTVVVENRRFRAHRSVLVSCSDYFGARMTNHANQGLVIALPDEVSAEGFEPLLQFAYTSKLLFTKENVLEIRNCANVLGFKNLDKACFDFILPKFFDSNRNSSKGPRKQCCKTKCWRSTKAKSSSNDDGVDDGVHTTVNDGVKDGVDYGINDNVNDGVNAREAPSGPPPFPAECEEMEPHCPYKPDRTTARGCSPCGFETEAEVASDYSLLCPKYRKFLLACGRSQSNVDANGSEAEITDGSCPLRCLPCSSAVLPSDETSPQVEEALPSPCCLLTKQSLPLAPSLQEVVEGPAARILDKESRASDCIVGTNCPSLSGAPGPEPRTCEEIEVANQLTLWHKVCNLSTVTSAPDVLERGLEQQCLRQSESGPRTTECPFLRDMAAVSAREEGNDRPVHSAESPYASSMQSGEDSDSFDTEGDSESYTSMRASELPFSVEQIASLSRNDFQQMLKVHCLTREQLEFVHDVRRRSKNRIAARRCRKRKLDCIYNLQCEIERLRSEKEKLTNEKQQLDQLKLKTWHSYTGLYDRLCAEARLQPEQVQVLAKYTSVGNCPLSAHLSAEACFHHCPEAELQARAVGCAAGLAAAANRCEPGPSTSSALEPPAGRARAALQSLTTPAPLMALPDPRPTDPLHTEPCEVASIREICPDQISKLETEKY
ncbi:transcription regulator protein BACH1b isoform X2 [Electrophorus electricus]|uniref:transcription regulator protein BACH1b isoform X2 n=1 Tax=Electrophorus electricus TaxID=8005 RepID=UPI0015D0B2A8|nr:transcription regulator protein BACH1b isoform X2 [Electrophorus electricus]